MSQLIPDICYQAMKAHDSRFDGRFFVGVTSTGIYCRPICKVRLPLQKNCTFHISAAAAEVLGFRPCLKCRPELAPGFAATEASQKLAHSAAKMLESIAEQSLSIADLAAKIGVSERHLRRIFRLAFGVSPVHYAQTQRLLLAKRLMTDTVLPVNQVALASGFSSVRRMNALFTDRYKFSPTRLRPERNIRAMNRQGKSEKPRPQAYAQACPQSCQHSDNALSFVLSYRLPYDFSYLLDFLQRRALSGVESVNAGRYTRTLRVRSAGGKSILGWLSVRQAPGKSALALSISPVFIPLLPRILTMVKRVFDLDAEPNLIADVLGDLVGERIGLRLPGAFDAFELSVRAILGQQVTVKAARTLANRFVTAFGTPMPSALSCPDAAICAVFPTPERVAGLSQTEISELGIISSRANAIRALAAEFASGALIHDTELNALAPNEMIAKLSAIPGIGPWSANYIVMRALSWPDAWPPGDVAVQNAMGLANNLAGHRSAETTSQKWRPWRSYAVLHIWSQLEPKK